jgi:glyine---[glycyl-carrier protein] ligase
MRGALCHQRYRMEDLRRDLGLRPEETDAYSTVVNVLPFGYHLSFAEHPVRKHLLSAGPVDDFAIIVSDRLYGSDARILFSANPEQYTAQELAAHQRRFVALLGQLAVAIPDEPLHRLDMLSAEERQTLLEGFNATASAVPERTLTGLFEEQVERTPEAVALLYSEQRLSYAELNERANRVAHHLIGLGVGPETLVGVALERSMEMVMALLGILKAGGAYLPLDPDYPEARLAYMLADAAPLLVISSAALRRRLPETVAVIKESSGPPHSPPGEAQSPARSERVCGRGPAVSGLDLQPAGPSVGHGGAAGAGVSGGLGGPHRSLPVARGGRLYTF